MSGLPWTVEATAQLRELAGTAPDVKAIAAAMGRTETAVRSRARDLRIALPSQKWLPEKTAELHQLVADGAHTDEIARALGASVQAIHGQFKRAGLKANRRPAIKEMPEGFIEAAAQRTTAQLVYLLQVSPGTIRRWLAQLPKAEGRARREYLSKIKAEKIHAGKVEFLARTKEYRAGLRRASAERLRVRNAEKAAIGRAERARLFAIVKAARDVERREQAAARRVEREREKAATAASPQAKPKGKRPAYWGGRREAKAAGAPDGLAQRAAEHLKIKTVFRPICRAKIVDPKAAPDAWMVGRERVTEAQLIERARLRGFDPDGWRAVAA